VKLILWLIVWGIGVRPVQASQADNFGLEAMSSGRAGSVLAETDNPHAAFFNPALLAAQKKPQFSFSTALSQVKTNPLGEINLPRSLRSSDDTLKENYSLSEVSQTRWALGFHTPVRLTEKMNRKSGLGFSLSGPYEKLRGFVAYAPDDFYLVRYGTADSQFKGTTSFGMEIIPEKLMVGLGLSLFLSGSGSAETVLSSTPTSRLNMDVVLETAPVLGLFSRFETFSTALTYHAALNPQLEQSMTAKIRLNEKDSLEQPLSMKSSLYFEPRQLNWELQTLGDRSVISLGLSYQFWSEYQAPVLLTETPDALGNTYRTPMPTSSFRNTLNPRFSWGLNWSGGFRTNLGYQYRPTPVSDLSQGANSLDSNTHITGLSVEKQFEGLGIIDSGLTLGVFGQIHYFTERKVTKTGPSSAGFPSYDFSGKAYLLGVSARADL